LHLCGDVFVESGKVCGDTGMKATDNFVEYFFLLAYSIGLEVTFGSCEAVLLINHLPYSRAIVVGEGLDVSI
jgi:hypothetical protein